MDRNCVRCNTTKTQIDKDGYDKWYKHEGGFICHSCYKKVNYLKNREYARKGYWKNPEKLKQRSKKWRKDNPEKYKKQYSVPRIKFKGESIHLKHNPRIGICSLCGEKTRTDLHHRVYSPDDPLANTIELCRRCHSKEHPRDRNDKGQFI